MLKLSLTQLKRIHILADEANMDRPTRVKIMSFFYGVTTSKNLTERNAERFIRRLEEIIAGEIKVAYRANGDPDWQYIGKF